MSTGLAVEALYVDGRHDRFDFKQEQVTVGSSKEADLCLPLEELSPKHILVVARETGCWVSVARGVYTQVLFNGAIVENQEVPWGAELDIGTVTLRLSEPIEKVRAREKSQQSLLRIAAMLALALVAFYLMQDTYVPPPRQNAEAPAIFGDPATPCSMSGDQVSSRAADLNAAAEAYWQRYPFDPQEGIRAAKLYGEATACYTSAGNVVMAKKMGEEQRSILEIAERDYQTLKLQLSRALKNKEYVRARDIVRELARFVSHRPGPYLEWLARVDTYLRNRIKDSG